MLPKIFRKVFINILPFEALFTLIFLDISYWLLLHLIILICFTQFQTDFQVQHSAVLIYKQLQKRIFQLQGCIPMILRQLSIRLDTILLSLIFVKMYGFIAFIVSMIICLIVWQRDIIFRDKLKVDLQANQKIRLIGILSFMMGIYLMTSSIEAIPLCILISRVIEIDSICRGLEEIYHSSLFLAFVPEDFDEQLERYRKFCVKQMNSNNSFWEQIQKIVRGIPQFFTLKTIMKIISVFLILQIIIIKASFIYLSAVIVMATLLILSKINYDQGNVELKGQKIEEIMHLLNSGFSPEALVQQMGLLQQTQIGRLVKEKARSLKRPPRPLPKQCRRSQKFRNQPGSILPVFEYQGKYDRLRKYQTFLIISEDKQEKQALLDILVNLIQGLEMEDNWRWTINQQNNPEQANTYHINDPDNKFNIKIVDIPSNQRKEYYKEIFSNNFIDYVMIGMEGCDQKIIKGVRTELQSLNVQIDRKRFIPAFISCSDLNRIKSLVTLNSLEQSQYYMFDISNLYTPKNENKEQNQACWLQNIQAMTKLKQFVNSRSKPSMNIKYHNESHAKIVESIAYENDQIYTQFVKLDETFEYLSQIEKYQSRIMGNINFKIPKTKYKFVSKPLGDTYQRCSKCQVDCCQQCIWPPQAKQSLCTYFHGGRNCPICPGNCPKSDHERSDKQIKKQLIQYTQYEMSASIKCIYKQGLSGIHLYERIHNQVTNEVKKLSEMINRRAVSIQTYIQQCSDKFGEDSDFSLYEVYRGIKDRELEQKNQGYQRRIDRIDKLIQRIKDNRFIEPCDLFQK